MSLINEALKKAQRQRTDPSAPVIMPAPTPDSGGPPSPRIAKRRPPMPARTLILLLVGGGLVLVMGGVITVVLLNMESAPVAAANSAPVHRPPVPTPAVTPPVPAVTLPTIAPVQVAVVVPPKPAPVPAPAPVLVMHPIPVPQPIQVAQTVPEVVVPTEPPAVPVRPPAPPKLAANPAVYTYLDTLRITGVRMSGGDSKVIMNDRIVRLNDYVDRALGLRLVKVTETSLVFTDDKGFEYTKPL